MPHGTYGAIVMTSFFDGGSLSFAAWRSDFLQDLKVVTLRVRPQLKLKLELYMSNML